jgi:hypothetical protein
MNLLLHIHLRFWYYPITTLRNSLRYKHNPLHLKLERLKMKNETGCQKQALPVSKNLLDMMHKSRCLLDLHMYLLDK